LITGSLKGITYTGGKNEENEKKIYSTFKARIAIVKALG
jgi:hypothetical protein